MANTDRSSIKRSRNEASEQKPKTPKKKKQKKNKTKNSGSSSKESESSQNPVSTLETTATPEGVKMTQMLSTFSRLEQSRFEAFRRSTFRSDAISNYVAYCLASCHEHAYSKSEKARQLLSGTSLGMGNPRSEVAMQKSGQFVKGVTMELQRETKRKVITEYPRLKDMVAPSQSDNIVLVVSTLAKAYAQRLVASARRVAAAEGYNTDKEALLPSHFQKAHVCLQQAGLDPGFMLQPQQKTMVVAESEAVKAAALGVENEYETMRNAALAAQDDYDQHMESKKKAEEEEETAKAATMSIAASSQLSSEQNDSDSDDEDGFEIVEEQILAASNSKERPQETTTTTTAAAATTTTTITIPLDMEPLGDAVGQSLEDALLGDLDDYDDSD